MEAVVCHATGAIYLAEPEVHTVQAGESLSGIAEEAGLAAPAIVAFNCGSLAPIIVRHYLKTTLGMEQFRPDAPLQHGALLIPRPFACEPGGSAELELRYWRAWYGLRLHSVSPDAVTAQDDRFTLVSDDGAYRSVQTVRDDVNKRNRFLDLKFYGLLPGRTYTLEIDPGEEGEAFHLFEAVPFDDLVKDHLPEEGEA